MTCNNIILSQPEAGAVQTHAIPDDVSARLNFGPQDISGLSLGSEGQLVISFVDGGQLNISNFESLIDNGNLLYLEDGTLIDQSILTDTLKSPQDFASIATAAGSDAITIGQPAANTRQEITLQNGQKYICDFDPANAATVEVKDGQMVLTFADGSQVVINNYSDVMAGDLPAELTIADGTVIDGAELLTMVTEIEAPSEEVLQVVEAEPQAEDVANIEPAAGDALDSVAEALAQVEPAAGDGAVSNSGYGFSSVPSSDPLNSPSAIGPLGPTALNYVAPVVQGKVLGVMDDQPIFSIPENLLDETALGVGNLVATGKINVDYGNDGPGVLEGTGTFKATCDVANDVLASGGIPVITTYDPVTGTYIGAAAGVTIFTFELDVTTGEYTYTQVKPFDHADSTRSNEPICLDFGIVATDADGDRTVSSVRVVVLDDAPVVTSQIAAVVDETDFTAGPLTQTGKFYADPGEDVTAVYAGNDTFAAVGSVAGGTLTSHGVPVVVTYDAVTSIYTGTAGGVTVFTLALDPVTADFTYTQFKPLDHADTTDPDDIMTLEFGVDVTDFDGDTASGKILVKVHDDAPEIKSVVRTVDETTLLTSASDVVNGTVTGSYGGDGAGEYSSTGTFVSSGSQLSGALTHNGVPVTVSFDAVTGTYTGVSGTTTIFTMQINNDGTYEFTLLSTLDHADPNNPNDIINLDFGTKVVDYDGDSATSTIRIHVKDDVPTIGNSSGDVDETNFDTGPLSYTDTVTHNFGLELGSINATGTNSSSTPLLSNGAPVTVAQVGNTYTGTAGGLTVFTLTIDPLTGEYTYTQFRPLDHPDATDHDDIISIDFGIEIESLDGTKDTGTITIKVADDGPDAVDDFNSAEEGQTITGDVVANDDLSEDAPNTVTNVKFGGTDYAVPAGGSVTISTTLGTMVMKSDGTYTYTTFNNDPNGTDVFTYTLVDYDGDKDTANLSIQVSPDGQPVAVDKTLAVDETNLTPGPMIYTGDLNVNFGIDGAGTVTPNGNFTPSGSLLGGNLTAGGVPVTVSFAGDTYTGVAGGVTIFTLQINNDGTYSFELLDNIDHADSTDPNDIITLKFGVTAKDADGDAADGTVTIHVHDDAPVAYDDGTQTVEYNQATGIAETVTGDVTLNDEFSEDSPTIVKDVLFNGATTSVPATGSVNIVGTYGTLTISSDGKYSYTGKTNNPNGTDTFTYVLQDYDGDRDTAEFSFKVGTDYVPVIINPVVETVDETNLAGGPNVKTGTVSVNYFTDGPGELNPNDIFSSSVSLVSCGHAVDVTLSGNTYTGVANGVTIFTMEILENGNYTFTQFEAIDHPNKLDHNDSITLNFGATATDADGDTVSTTLKVNILDDGPTIGQIATEVDETNITGGSLTATGTVPHDFGQDGAGSITTNGLFEAKFQMTGAPVTLTTGGVAITVTSTANGYVGTSGGQVIFTLDIDPATGDYTYKQFDAIDHPDATNPDDVIWLKFYVDITDCDGDMDTGIIIIDVHDDGPTAVNDSITGTSGDVLLNDSFGVDGAGSLVKFNIGGTWHNAGSTVNTFLGQVTLNSDGSYSLAPGAPVVTTNTRTTSSDSHSDYSAVTNTSTSTHSGVTNVTHNDYSAVTNTTHRDYDGAATTSTSSSDVTVRIAGGWKTTTSTTTTTSITCYRDTTTTTTDYRDTITETTDYRDTTVQTTDYRDTTTVTKTYLDTITTTGGSLNITYQIQDGDGDTSTAIATVSMPGGSTTDTVLTGTGSNTVTHVVNVHSNTTTVSTGVHSSSSTTTVGSSNNTTTSVVKVKTTDDVTDVVTVVLDPVSGDGGDGGGDGVGGNSGTPLVLDLDGDGIELISAKDGVLFDMDLDGVADQTAWAGSDDGLLALDKNEDGIINDRSELFGDTDGFSDGFDNLSSYDSNKDGVINADDEIFDELLVWKDENSDGVSDAGELLSLKQIGIVSISLNAAMPDDLYIEGNWISHVSTYLTEDGQEHEIVDVWFQYEDGAEGNVISATTDADTFIFQAIQDGIVEIQNFDVTADSIDLSALIQGDDDISDAINDYVFITEENGSAVISVDVDGAAGPAEAVAVAKLDGVSKSSVDDLIDSGDIIV